MSESKTSIDYSRAFTWLLSITLAFVAWFGKVVYEKLNSIDNKVEALLVQNGIQKTEIDNLKEQIKGMTPCRNNNEKTVAIVSQEGMLPDNIQMKKKHSLSSK